LLSRAGTGPSPAATFGIESVEGGDACSRVGTYCVEVACTGCNTGPVEGVAEVEISLLRRRKPPVVRRQRASIPISGSAVLVEYFSIAAKSDESRGVCNVC
jgi:hypothetical protein